MYHARDSSRVIKMIITVISLTTNNKPLVTIHRISHCNKVCVLISRQPFSRRTPKHETSPSNMAVRTGQSPKQCNYSDKTCNCIEAKADSHLNLEAYCSVIQESSVASQPLFEKIRCL